MQLKKVLSLLDLIILLTKFSIDIYTNNTCNYFISEITNQKTSIKKNSPETISPSQTPDIFPCKTYFD